MAIGVGLPSMLAGADVLEWARAGERAGFDGLGVVDRVVYHNHEPIPVLAAAAAVTSRVRLTTGILIGPVRGNGTVLAKQLATVDSLSGGRLTAGLALGGREDDYASTNTDFATRGAAFDAQLAVMRSIWQSESPKGKEIGPEPVQAGGPPLLIGGHGAAAVRRVVTHGAGWIAGAAGTSLFAQGAERVRQAWSAAGRDGSPRLVAMAYYALGAHAEALAREYILNYYDYAGDFAQVFAKAALTSADMIRQAISEFAEAGCDELLLMPCVGDIDQLRKLALVTVARGA